MNINRSEVWPALRSFRPTVPQTNLAVIHKNGHAVRFGLGIYCRRIAIKHEKQKRPNEVDFFMMNLLCGVPRFEVVSLKSRF